EGLLLRGGDVFGAPEDDPTRDRRRAWVTDRDDRDAAQLLDRFLRPPRDRNPDAHATRVGRAQAEPDRDDHEHEQQQRNAGHAGQAGPVVATSPRASLVAGPTPGTRSRSSMLANGPPCSRSVTMRSAVTGPIPGSASSALTSALLI